jgi:hypothetical protein
MALEKQRLILRTAGGGNKRNSVLLEDDEEEDDWEDDFNWGDRNSTIATIEEEEAPPLSSSNPSSSASSLSTSSSTSSSSSSSSTRPPSTLMPPPLSTSTLSSNSNSNSAATSITPRSSSALNSPFSSASYNEQVFNAVEIGDESQLFSLLSMAEESFVNMVRDSQHRSLLHIAAAAGHFGILARLTVFNVEKVKLDPNEESSRTITSPQKQQPPQQPLPNFLEVLDSRRRTPLHYACLGGTSMHVRTAQVLLHLGANINARTAEAIGHDTPLHLLIRSLRRQALPTSKLLSTSFRHLSSSHSPSSDSVPSSPSLQTHSNHQPGPIPSISPIPASASMMGSSSALKNSRSPDVLDPLGLRELMSLMIQKGVDINAKNTVGDTPLHEACAYGREQCAMFLLNGGANSSTFNQ